jgi:hypothetical protein
MADRAFAKPRLAAVARLIRDLPGGSFAFVMATGIVSIADGLIGLGGFATLLLAINLVASSRPCRWRCCCAWCSVRRPFSPSFAMTGAGRAF